MVKLQRTSFFTASLLANDIIDAIGAIGAIDEGATCAVTFHHFSLYLLGDVSSTRLSCTRFSLRSRRLGETAFFEGRDELVQRTLPDGCDVTGRYAPGVRRSEKFLSAFELVP